MTETHSQLPSRAGAPVEVGTRLVTAGGPVINPFAVRKSINPLAQPAQVASGPTRWPLALAIFVLLGGVGYFGYERWMARAVEQAKEQQAEEVIGRQRRDAAGKAADAEDALKAGDLVKARDLFSKAASLNPSEKRFKTRLQEAQSVLDQQVQPMVAQAQLFLERSMYEKAITEAQSALAIDPAHPAAVSIKTTAAHYKETEGSSEEKLFRVSNLQKFLDRGDEAFDKKDYEGARELYQVAFDLSPKNDEAEAKMAKVTAKLGEARITRGRESAIIDEAMKLLEGRKYRAAFEKVQIVLEAVPESEKAKQAMVRINEAMDRQKNLELYKKLALQAYHIGKEGQALEYFKKWQELEPDSRDAKFYIDQLKGAGN